MKRSYPVPTSDPDDYRRRQPHVGPYALFQLMIESWLKRDKKNNEPTKTRTQR